MTKKKAFRSERNYKDWMYVKDEVQFKKRLHNFKEWEIWWCAIGENVGTEINGKGSHFVRPIVVFRKFDKLSFTAIPLTTKDHTDKYPDWYTHFRFRNINEFAVINQLHYCSAFRLYRKIGEIDDKDITKIVDNFKKL